MTAANDGDATQRHPLDGYRADRVSGHLTAQQEVRADHTGDASAVGERSPTLLEDLRAREKVTH